MCTSFSLLKGDKSLGLFSCTKMCEKSKSTTFSYHKKCAKVSLCWKGTKVTWNRGSNNLASSHNNSSRASYLNSVNYCNTLHFFNKVFDKASIQMFPIIPLLLWHSTQQVNGQSFRFAYCFNKISPLSFQIEYLGFSHLIAGLSSPPSHHSSQSVWCNHWVCTAENQSSDLLQWFCFKQTN